MATPEVEAASEVEETPEVETASEEETTPDAAKFPLVNTGCFVLGVV